MIESNFIEDSILDNYEDYFKGEIPRLDYNDPLAFKLMKNEVILDILL